MEELWVFKHCCANSNSTGGGGGGWFASYQLAVRNTDSGNEPKSYREHDLFYFLK